MTIDSFFAGARSGSVRVLRFLTRFPELVAVAAFVLLVSACTGGRP